MSISYKTLWQEVKDENERLRAENRRLRSQQRQDAAAREIDRLRAFITAHRSDLVKTPAIVDLAGIARHMRVSRHTPGQWNMRHLLPDPDFPEIKGEPIWLAATIKKQFAEATGRPWYDTADDDEDLPSAA